MCNQCRNSTKLASTLSEIGEGKVSTFLERKMNQKCIFLLDRMGVKGIKFRYNWYIHGPYSAELTEHIYDIQSLLPTLGPNSKSFDNWDTQIFEKFKKLNDELLEMEPSIANKHEKLELITSMIYLYSISPPESDVKRLVIRSIKALKPQFSTWDLNAYWDLIRNHELI